MLFLDILHSKSVELGVHSFWNKINKNQYYLHLYLQQYMTILTWWDLKHNVFSLQVELTSNSSDTLVTGNCVYILDSDHDKPNINDLLFPGKTNHFCNRVCFSTDITCKCMSLISSWGICAEVHFVHPAKWKIFMPCELKTFDSHKDANICLYKSECKLLKWDSWKLPNKKYIHKLSIL